MFNRDDIKDDFLSYVDNIVLVTYKRRSTGDTFTDIPNIPALFREYDNPEMSVSMVAVHIPVDSLAFKPSQKDLIQESNGDTWVVDKVLTQTWKTRYKIIAHKQQ